MTKYGSLLLTLVVFAYSTGAKAQAAVSCRDLATLKFEAVENLKAEAVAAGASVPISFSTSSGPLPAHCHVTGVIHHRVGVGGEEFGINFALALPDKDAWNGDLVMQGGGGANGFVGYPLGASFTGDKPALMKGFAVASTDTGHKAKTMPFDFSFYRDQQAYLDYAYMANAEVAALAKQIIAKFYAKAPSYSYFVGCSNGGREAMILSQRYPSTFNGIVAGDPGIRVGYSNFAIGKWMPTAYNAASPKDSAGKPEIQKFLSDDERKLFMGGLMKACDAKDGIADGMISDPLGCNFDPTILECKSGQTESCIAPEKIAAIKTAFAGPKDGRGNEVYPGFLYDTGIAITGFVPGLLAPDGNSLFGPTTKETTIDVDQELLKASDPLNDPKPDPLVNPESMNLSTFSGSGGKIIYFHGNSDPWFSSLDTLEYYKSLAAKNGGQLNISEWSQLYLVPGMGHCSGGPSLDQFDMLGAIVAWVEKGKAPESILATGKAFPGRSRPLCAYPRHAQYIGHGDSEDAKNFDCE